MIIRNIRHRESVGFIKAPRPKLSALQADFRRIARGARVEPTAKDRESLSDFRGRLAHVGARVQAMRDAVRASQSLCTSATTGYVRDAGGRRLRPMSPADLQAAADKHDGRSGSSARTVDSTAYERPETTADLARLHAEHYRRRA